MDEQQQLAAQVRRGLAFRLCILPSWYLTNNEEIALRIACRIFRTVYRGYLEDHLRGLVARAQSGDEEAR